MNIQIRRNTSISFSFSVNVKDKEAIKKMFEPTKLTTEQRAMLDEGKRQCEELKRKVWEYFEQHPTKDLDGELITKETHEIGCDRENMEIDGCMWGVAKQVYVQPKKNPLTNNIN